MTDTTQRSGRSHFTTLFPRRLQVRLGLAFAGSVLVSLVETASILMLLPMLSLLSGASTESGYLRVLSDLTGNPGRDRLVVYSVVAVVAGFILKDLFTIAFRWWMSGFLLRQQIDTSTRIFAYLLHAPFPVHLRRGVPDLMRSMGDSVSLFYGRYVGGLFGLATEAVTIVTIVGAMLVVLPVETLAIIVYFATASWLFIRIVKPRAEQAGLRQMQAGKAAFEAALHGFGGIKDIKIRHSQAHFTDAYRSAAWEGATAGRFSGFLSELPKYLLEILFIIAIGILVGLALSTGSQANLFATIALLGAAAFRILPSLTRILASATIMRSGISARDLLYRDLDDEMLLAPLTERATPTDKLPLTRSLDLTGVSFAYASDARAVLTDVTLSIPAGSSVALVGGSGAGKTTLANLLLGLLTPTQGTITADGVDIAPRLAQWQNNLALIPQEVYLMDASLRENIAFDQPREAIDEALLASCIERAQLGDLIAELPGGLDATLGDRGLRLSGGQRQRVGIARALYRQPRVLIMDEATSALDNETEHRITETIHELAGDVTLIVIAHRLSTVRDLDRIVLLNEGRVAATGTFHELNATNPEFANLVRLGSLSTDETPERG